MSKTIKVAILDDEQHSIDALIYELKDLDHSIEIIATYRDPRIALSGINEIGIDLLFIDIKMPGMSGTEFISKCNDRTFDVIFTTAYSEFAVQAFRLDVMDYLLKPVGQKNLIQAIEKHLRKKITSSINDKVIYQNLPPQSNYAFNKFAIPSTDKIEFIDSNLIIRMEAQGNYTAIVTSDKQYIVSKSLGECLDTIPMHFIRVHRSHLVNPDFITGLSKGKINHLLMSDKFSAPISNEKKSDVLRLLKML